ncbi:MAG: molybdopterin-dependent oxidoreductase [Bacteroidota bacterium]|nr:molybdopterin-dependent oxidoreductase [Bacteroidota bacterium]
MQTLTLRVNGRERSFLIEEHETLARVLRERAQLTGTKIGCEQGSCGACTVLVNGQPTLSCITPALRYDGAEVTTVEGVANGSKLNAVQEALIEHGALQCGYCTPGIVTTATAFLESNPHPTRAEIAEAISGNICRCTGYQKIIDGIEAAANAEFQPEQPSIPHAGSVIGKRTPLLDSRKKVTGEAKFTDDIIVPNALFCAFLRSTEPHATIESIDTTATLAMPGVRAVATGKDLTETFGVLAISQDQTAIAVEKVRFIGEIVAAVAAETEAEARNALKTIVIRYKPLPTAFHWKDALRPTDKAGLIHEQSTKHGCNLHKQAEMQLGARDETRPSAFTSSMEFDFPGINHAFLEPHAAIAVWDEHDGLTLTSATQVPHYTQRALAKVLHLPLEKVRVIKPFVGSGFGGKSDPFAHEMIVSYFAIKTCRPVRTRLSREEVFLTNHGRHPTHIALTTSMDAAGKLLSTNADVVIDGGAYGSFGVVTTYYNGVLLQAPYALDQYSFRSRRVYTNKPACGAMRGHGAVNPRYAMEVVLDDLAHQAGLDPIELRLQNLLPGNTQTLGQYRITSNGLPEAIETIRRDSGWDEKHGKLPHGRGIGVACGFFISGSALPIIWNDLPQSVVHLKVDFDGRVVIYSGASDIGQGSDTMLALVVAEELGVSLSKTFVHAADTRFTPVDLGSYSSRVTFMAGNAAKSAATKMRETILEAVARQHEIQATDLTIVNDRIQSANQRIDLSWQEAIDIATAHRGALATSGWYISPKLGGDFKGAGAGLSPSYSFGALIAEVEVNPTSGALRVLDLWGAHDCGRALNRLAVEGQLEGSWHMGMGQAVSEAMEFYDGLLLNGNLLDYRIPTSVDTPPIHTNIIETMDPEGPFGAKECGEGALHPVIPAIANAVFDAVGVRVTTLPITSESLLAAMKHQKFGEGRKVTSLTKKKLVKE